MGKSNPYHDRNRAVREMPQNGICCCGCDLRIPADRRSHSAYLNKAHQNRAYRQRRKERVAGYVDLCFDCAHPEEFHTIPHDEMEIVGAESDVQQVLMVTSAELACSQINCKCMGHVPLAKDSAWNALEGL